MRQVRALVAPTEDATLQAPDHIHALVFELRADTEASGE
jgi:hypothetical protein